MGVWCSDSWLMFSSSTHSCQLVNHALLLENLQLEELDLLIVGGLIQIIQRLEFLQWRVGGNLLLLNTTTQYQHNSIEKNNWFRNTLK